VVTQSDDKDSLMFAMKTMRDTCRELVGEVSGGSNAVAEASGQIAEGGLDLSQRTEEQASTLEETASSMEELTSTVRQNAANASQANTRLPAHPRWRARAAAPWARWWLR